MADEFHLAYVLDGGEDITDCAGKDARNILSPQHGISFATGRLPIHEHRPIVPLEGGLSQRSHHRMVNGGSLTLRPKYVIKLEALRLHRILIPPPQLFLPDEGIYVDLAIGAGSRDLIHGDGHWVKGIRQIRVQRLDLVVFIVDTPNFLILVGSE
jgi:hypothetical protein